MDPSNANPSTHGATGSPPLGYFGPVRITPAANVHPTTIQPHHTAASPNEDTAENPLPSSNVMSPPASDFTPSRAPQGPTVPHFHGSNDDSNSNPLSRKGSHADPNAMLKATTSTTTTTTRLPLEQETLNACPSPITASTTESASTSSYPVVTMDPGSLAGPLHFQSTPIFSTSHAQESTQKTPYTTVAPLIYLDPNSLLSGAQPQMLVPQPSPSSVPRSSMSVNSSGSQLGLSSNTTQGPHSVASVGPAVATPIASARALWTPGNTPPQMIPAPVPPGTVYYRAGGGVGGTTESTSVSTSIPSVFSVDSGSGAQFMPSSPPHTTTAAIAYATVTGPGPVATRLHAANASPSSPSMLFHQGSQSRESTPPQLGTPPHIGTPSSAGGQWCFLTQPTTAGHTSSSSSPPSVGGSPRIIYYDVQSGKAVASPNALALHYSSVPAAPSASAPQQHVPPRKAWTGAGIPSGYVLAHGSSPSGSTRAPGSHSHSHLGPSVENTAVPANNSSDYHPLTQENGSRYGGGGGGGGGGAGGGGGVLPNGTEINPYVLTRSELQASGERFFLPIEAVISALPGSVTPLSTAASAAMGNLEPVTCASHSLPIPALTVVSPSVWPGSATSESGALPNRVVREVVSPIPAPHPNADAAPTTVVGISHHRDHKNTAPQPEDTKNTSRGSPSHTAGQDDFVDVYDSSFTELLHIPAEKVYHRPSAASGVTRLVLCRNYQVGGGLGALNTTCAKGDQCKFVHADTSDASRHSIHVNYVWKNLDAYPYPRLPAGDQLLVFAPNQRPPVESIPSERVLVTRGALSWKEHPLAMSHCAHYYFNRTCNRGERCNFIHSVYLDPTSEEAFKRAPAPSTVAPAGAEETVVD